MQKTTRGKPIPKDSTNTITISNVKIGLKHTLDPKIKIIDISGSLTGDGAKELQGFFHSISSKEKRYFIMDIRDIKGFDSNGNKALEDCINHGVYIRNLGIAEEEGKWSGMSDNKKVLLQNEANRESIISWVEEE